MGHIQSKTKRSSAYKAAAKKMEQQEIADAASRVTADVVAGFGIWFKQEQAWHTLADVHESAITWPTRGWAQRYLDVRYEWNGMWVRSNAEVRPFNWKDAGVYGPFGVHIPF
jgi:hypothetical protein